MATLAQRLLVLHRKAGRWTLAGLPEGADAMVLAEIARTTGGQDILHVARDGQRLERLQDGLRFFAPEREVLVFPAWDCLPYDRLSPHPDIVAERLHTLSKLAAAKPVGKRLGHGVLEPHAKGQQFTQHGGVVLRRHGGLAGGPIENIVIRKVEQAFVLVEFGGVKGHDMSARELAKENVVLLVAAIDAAVQQSLAAHLVGFVAHLFPSRVRKGA